MYKKQHLEKLIPKSSPWEKWSEKSLFNKALYEV